MMLGRMGMLIAFVFGLQAAPASAAEQSLVYETYKTSVEPIFLKKRPGHARCVVCHMESNNAFRLQKLTPGSTSWTEEQSRRNFEMVSKLVVLSDPLSSRLLLAPLAPEAGGAAYHSGGRQFSSKNDPDWEILAQWAAGQNQAVSPTK
jgi:hypothetical protein